MAETGYNEYGSSGYGNQQYGGSGYGNSAYGAGASQYVDTSSYGTAAGGYGTTGYGTTTGGYGTTTGGYGTTGYGTTTSGYSTAGRQSMSAYRSNTSAGSLSPMSPTTGGAYGSPTPRSCTSPGVQIAVPTGRRNAAIGLQGQASNVIGNNPYGRYDSCSSLGSTGYMGQPHSGMATPSAVRPSALKLANFSSSPNMMRPGSRSPGARFGAPRLGGQQFMMGRASPSPIRGGRPGPQTYISPTANTDIIRFFNAVDTDRSGRISWDELQKALLNGDWTEFNEETCRLMISMFDTNWAGTVDVNEFSALWKYIQDWKAMFEGFDTDCSGTIDVTELHRAFQSFGYQLSIQFTQLVVAVYDKKGIGAMNFDGFINACVLLKLLTTRFEERDMSGCKTIQIDMEQFIEMVLDTFLLQV